MQWGNQQCNANYRVRINDDNFIYSTENQQLHSYENKIATSKNDLSDLQSLSTSLLGYKTHP